MNRVTRSATALVALLTLATAACGEGETSAPTTEGTTEPTTTSAAPSTTVPGTTTSPSTSTVGSTTVVTTTTEPPEVPYWTVGCTEVDGAGPPPTSDARLESFGGLGAAPTLDLVLPVVVTSAGPSGSIAATVPIPGGVLVGVYPPDSWPSPDEVLTSSSLVAVDHDGTVRWRRCFDADVETRRFAVAPAALEPEVAWVLSTSWDEPVRIAGVDLATGADVSLPADVAGLGERGGGSDRFVVLGPPLGDGPVEAGDRLVVIDALDGSATEVPVPPAWVGGEGGYAQVVDRDPVDGEYVLADGFPGPGETAAVYLDGAWTDDPDVRRDLLPVQVTETFGEPFELRLLDGAGDLVWSAPDFHGISREGFRWAVAQDVVVAVRCASPDAEGACGWIDDEPPQEELVGFDLATGEELWSLPGSRAVPVIAGDEAIVSDWDEQAATATGYVLLDLRTGERIGPEGDPWPIGSFAQECCGGDVYVNVHRHGGVVVATDQEHVRIWFPPELTAPTATVDLMS